MAKTRFVVGLLSVGALAAGLGGCERVEQAATEVVESARQSAAQALEEARQSGSADQARQSAEQVLDEARRQAAGLLDEASQYLSRETRGDEAEPETSGAPDSEI